MSIARHHAEWLGLVDVSGPFLSIAVLEQAFPQGIDTVESDLRERLRIAHEEWLDEGTKPEPDPTVHVAWVRYVFRAALEFDDGDVLQNHPSLRVSVPEQREPLEPTFAILDPAGGADRPNAGKPRVLVSVVDPAQGVEKAMRDGAWKAAPVDRMVLLLRGLQAAGGAARLGLVTNGAEWTLVHVAPGETTTYVGWQSELWFDEPLTLRAFVSLLRAGRFFNSPPGGSTEELIRASAKDAHEVTDRLGAQVRRATEVLIQTIDRLDRGRRGKLLEGISSVTLYEAAVTVMMRLVFVLAAEERKLLLLGTAVYDQHYAASTLHDQLQAMADRHGEEVLTKRFDAWPRLCATFRAIFAGVAHVDLRLPAHGGSLLDPDRFPFLEGRALGTSWADASQRAVAPLAIDNRTVLHLLRAITRLDVKAGGGRVEQRRLSFRAIDVEQIGHVYEGLLDHTAKRADDVTLSLTGKLEPEVAVAALEAKKKAGAELVPWLVDETGRSASALEGAIAYKLPKDEDRRLLVACENVTATYERVRPWAGLVRKDTSGQPVVIPKGAVYVTEGQDRRSSGTHYTPKDLAEEIVLHTLEPLVYGGPADGAPRDAWKLKSAKELLALRVCDLAMGSGAFLVAACRYLGKRLVEAWELEEQRTGARFLLAPNGEHSTGALGEHAIPLDEDERAILAQRYVAGRCLYGVDINPAAVEMGKLSIWLTTMQKGRPFNFVDHALRVGDSLLGVTSVEQLVHFHIDPKRGKELHGNNLFAIKKPVEDALRRAQIAREKLEDFATNDINAQNSQAFLLKEARDATADLRLVGDLVIGAALATAKKGDIDRVLESHVPAVLDWFTTKDPGTRAEKGRKLGGQATEMLNGGDATHRVRRPLHWPVEFPEVMDATRGGFDAFVGNPPFRGGTMISSAYGGDYREYLTQVIATGHRSGGRVDLCTYFFLRGAALLRPDGCMGLIATNTIAQGDSREVGLDALTRERFAILRAISSIPWPGSANLEVAHVWLRRGGWHGRVALNGTSVGTITPQLTEQSRTIGNPYGLVENRGKAFKGVDPMGLGFVMTPEQAQELIRKNRCNQNVLRPYLTGQDLNSDPHQRASRWIINFFDWPLDRGTAPAGYTGPVARDYPDCLSVVENMVKPERQTKAADVAKAPWWRYWRSRPALYAAIARLKHCYPISAIARHHSFVALGTEAVFDHNLNIIAVDGFDWFTVLQSGIHIYWATTWSSGLETRPGYRPTDAFETFPMPKGMAQLERLGAWYHRERADLMAANQEGLTKTYNRFHDPDETSPGVRRLRELHVEMDEAVKVAYGWTDLRLDHGFHETNHGIRYTIGEPARVEVMDRLLALNHERYAEEVKAGLHDEKKPKVAAKAKGAVAKPAARPKRKAAAAQLDLVSSPLAAGIAAEADGAWRRGDSTEFVEEEALWAIAAVLKSLKGPTPARVARLAATVALEPRLLTRSLVGDEAEHWVRVVGQEAQLRPKGVRALPPRATPGWKSAETDLREWGHLADDLKQGTWAPGPGVDAHPTAGWPDGRARFALAVIERLGFDAVEQTLSETYRRSVGAG